MYSEVKSEFQSLVKKKHFFNESWNFTTLDVNEHLFNSKQNFWFI